MIKFQGATKSASLFRGSQKLAGFGILKFEILKSVKQDFAPYRFASEIYTVKFGAAQDYFVLYGFVPEKNFLLSLNS
jgi:hypothetical protein